MAKKITKAEIQGLIWIMVIGLPVYWIMQLGESIGWVMLVVTFLAIIGLAIWYQTAKTKETPHGVNGKVPR